MPLERISFPDVEKNLIDYLKSELTALGDSALVVAKMPDPKPARVVRVFRDDRRRRQDVEDREGHRGTFLILDRPRMVLECQADDGTAAVLARTVRSILTGSFPRYIGAMWVDDIEDAGVENDTDPVTAAPRYVVTADLYVRGTVL
ncbi:hypothetical protein [Nocardia inohanensis]|uniref:hypothetical protein n=1 Tax=Nocardia inohanensis TaxID=209246 RepID=UPI0012FC97FA|nr:hypothetical protein [Nocardia inohanensis]